VKPDPVLDKLPDDADTAPDRAGFRQWLARQSADTIADLHAKGTATDDDVDAVMEQHRNPLHFSDSTIEKLLKRGTMKPSHVGPLVERRKVAYAEQAKAEREKMARFGRARKQPRSTASYKVFTLSGSTSAKGRVRR
jgi:hypothetical protein